MKTAKIIPLLLILSLLAGCAAPVSAGEPTADTAAERIYVTLPTLDTTVLRGLPEVQAAVNDITIPEIGVEISFVTPEASEGSVLYPQWITQGKQLDLIELNNENIENYVNRDLLLPLNSLLDSFGHGIWGISDTYQPLFGGTVNDVIYTVDVPGSSIGTCGGLWIGKSRLEEVSFHYEPDKVYSLPELDILFSRLKALYPDCYPLGQITSTYPFSTVSFFLGIPSVSCGNDIAVMEIGDESGTFRNKYTLPAYRELLEYLHKWYESGFIYPDSAITAASGIGLYRAGIVLSVPHIGTPDMLNAETMGEAVICLRLSPVRHTPRDSAGTSWAIPATSRAPEAAMKFLNLMYTDERIINLLSCGIEGRDYSMEGGFHRLDTLLFYNPLGVFGDQRLRCDSSDELKAARAAFSEKSRPLGFEYADFAFDTAPVQRELSAVARVENAYIGLLESGCLDFETVYPEFLAALDAAGAGKIIAEKQRQFDNRRVAHN